MENVQVEAESIIKFEEVKGEPDDAELLQNVPAQPELSKFLQPVEDTRKIKQEGEEVLEPPAAVFIKMEVTEETLEDIEDSRATSGEDIFSNLLKDRSVCSSGMDPQPGPSRDRGEKDKDLLNALLSEEEFSDSESGGNPSDECDSGNEQSRGEIESNIHSATNFEYNVDPARAFPTSSQPSPETHPISWGDYPFAMNKPHFVFSEPVRLKVPVSGNFPVNYFNLFFTDDFVDRIVASTNQNAENLFSEGSKGSIKAGWKELTRDEFRRFLGLLFHMGVIKLSHLAQYWSKDELFRIPVFAETMSRNRFLSILWAMHFADSTAVSRQQKKIEKIKLVVDCFNNRMSAIYSPQRELSLDEPMGLWRGRLGVRQYIQGRKHKCRVKLYVLCEAAGPALQAMVCAGSQDQEVDGLSHTEWVVTKLLDSYKGKGHSVYIDKFYNSIDLTKKLLANCTYVTGTLMPQRKSNPLQVVNSRLQKGEVKSLYAEGICVFKWKDNNEVLALSSEFPGRLIPTPNRKGIEVKKPEAFIQYKRHMKGIDHFDQMLLHYSLERNILRWYKKIAIHFFQLMVLNSYLLFNRYSGTKTSFHYFLLSLIKNLVSTGNPQIHDTISPGHAHCLEHVPVKIERLTTEGRSKRIRCRQCSKHKIVKLTSYLCPKCPHKPGLCPGRCFQLYHT